MVALVAGCPDAHPPTKLRLLEHILLGHSVAGLIDKNPASHASVILTCLSSSLKPTHASMSLCYPMLPAFFSSFAWIPPSLKRGPKSVPSWSTCSLQRHFDTNQRLPGPAPPAACKKRRVALQSASLASQGCWPSTSSSTGLQQQPLEPRHR